MLKVIRRRASLLFFAVMIGCAGSDPPPDGIVQDSVPVDSFLNAEMYLYDLLVAAPDSTTGTSFFHRQAANRLWFDHCRINVFPASTVPAIDTLSGHFVEIVDEDTTLVPVLLGLHFDGNVTTNWQEASLARERQFAGPWGLGSNMFYSLELTDTTQAIEPPAMLAGLTPKPSAGTTNLSFVLPLDGGDFENLVAHEFGHQLSVRHEDAGSGDLMHDMATQFDTNISQAQCNKATSYGVSKNYIKLDVI